MTLKFRPLNIAMPGDKDVVRDAWIVDAVALVDVEVGMIGCVAVC